MTLTISKQLLIIIMDNVGATLCFLDLKEGETNYVTTLDLGSDDAETLFLKAALLQVICLYQKVVPHLVARSNFDFSKLLKGMWCEFLLPCCFLWLLVKSTAEGSICSVGRRRKFSIRNSFQFLDCIDIFFCFCYSQLFKVVGCTTVFLFVRVSVFMGFAYKGCVQNLPVLLVVQ